MIFRFLTSLWLCLATSTIAAADVLPLFQESTPLKAVLSAPLTQIYREKRKEERLYYPGHWSYNGNEGATRRLDVKVRTRGVFRREHCRLPPLRLNFRKSTVKGTLFRGQNKLKLVGPCNTGRSDEQLLALEYLVYRMFEVVSGDYHFKTRLIELSYVDTDKNRKPWTDMTFVIEDESDLGKRIKRQIQKDKLSPAELDPQAAATVELFQYMIGNTDFSTIRSVAGRDCCHNIKLFRDKKGQGGVIPIPYDFDSSGFVNAPYAGVSEKLPIKTVRQRHFMGRCRNDSAFADSVALFRQKREAVLDVVRQSTDITDRQRRNSLKYLEEFFQILDDPKRTESKLKEKCK